MSLRITGHPAQVRSALPAGRAFTLIELLIVVAIIAILAAIAVPNFLEAQTRSKVSRVKADMRAMMTAIETYQVDNNKYPYRRNLNTSVAPPTASYADRIEQMSRLTTPIAYLTSLPPDPFERFMKGPENVIEYYDATQSTWLQNAPHNIYSGTSKILAEDTAGYLLISVGPDGYLGPVSNTCDCSPQQMGGIQVKGSIYRVYDPTNGTNSWGNIYGGSNGGLDTISARLTRQFLPGN